MACDFILDSDEHGEFCVIPLGGKTNLFTKIDVQDFEDIGRFNWCLWAPTGRKHRYAMRKQDKTTVKMHRQILGVKDGVFVDHINGDGLENRRFNLRVATNSQNQWNQSPREGTSQYKGVCWHVRDKKWTVGLMYRGKRIWIGQFDSEIVDGVDIGEMAAAKAYDIIARMYFGSFACLNCPNGTGLQTSGNDAGGVPNDTGLQACGKDTAGVPEETMTIYKISEKDEKKAIKLIAECKAENVAVTSEILSNRTVGELELMCKYLGCNISQLAGKIVGGVLG